MLNVPWKCALQFVSMRSDTALVLRASNRTEELCAAGNKASRRERWVSLHLGLRDWVTLSKWP